VFAGGILAAADRDPESVRGHPKAQLIDELRGIAERNGLDVFQLAAGFVKSCPDVSLILVGMSSPEHLHRNVHLMATSTLTADTRAETEAVLERHAAVLGGA
jgi:aryl-alcohol dehydrogenase-like predicted oxidoreductase